MITEENWINFIQTFFGAKASAEWIHHVAVGWNHHKNEPGCHCTFTWYDGSVPCEVYTTIKDAKTDLINTGEIYNVDIEGVGQFIERGQDFYEEDEPVEDVIEAFESGHQGHTTMIISTDDYLNALKSDDAPNLKGLAKNYIDAMGDSELPDATQVLPPYAEADIKFAKHMERTSDTGAHPKLKQLVEDYKSAEEDKVDADEAQAVKDFEEDGPGHGYWEKGDL